VNVNMLTRKSSPKFGKTHRVLHQKECHVGLTTWREYKAASIPDSSLLWNFEHLRVYCTVGQTIQST